MLVPVLFALGGCAHTSPSAPVADNTYSIWDARTAKPVLHAHGTHIYSEPAPDQQEQAQPILLDLPLSGTLTAAAIVDRAVARHKQEQRMLALRSKSDGSEDMPLSRSRSSRRHRGKQSGAQSAAGQLAAAELDAATPCAVTEGSNLRGKRKSGKSRSAVPTCAIAQRDDTGATGLNTVAVQRSVGRRGDNWDTVRSGLVLAGVKHERLDAHLEHLREHAGSVDFLMNRAEPYLQYLLGEIRRQGLPYDLIMVPMVESAFQTTALSHKQAAGIWQFIPSTGQQYGLQLTENYDGRYDTHPATLAALKYLKHLNNLFDGDWLLAFAAYNAGEGAVQRAIQANRLAGGGGTFWELSLPTETQNYVVKILALAKVIADPAAHGFRPHKSSSRNVLARVEARPEVPIADLIASSGIAPDEFYRLNPAFKPDVEPPPSQAHNFLLPLEKAEMLMAANLQGAKVYAPRKVVVKKGETLTQLARRHGVPEMKLSEWNGLPPKATLKAGQEILVMGV